MKRSYLSAAAIVFLGLFLIGSLGYSQTLTLVKKCCFAGVYKGEHKDIGSNSCPDPGQGKFTLYLKQDKDCGSRIWGKIVDGIGEDMEFKGTITAGPGECCTIEARASKPGESVTFKGILCKDGEKWVCRKGTYVSSRGCTGTFTLERQLIRRLPTTAPVLH